MNDDNEYGLWITRNYASTRPDDDAMVKVKLRSGHVHPDARTAKEWNWNIDGMAYNIVAYRVKLVKPAAEIKGHPHAALMAEYAKDAALMAEPWKLWQVQIYDCAGWGSLDCNPSWGSQRQYRRKPAEIPTEVVNGFVVPKALTEAPRFGAEYFMVHPDYAGWYSCSQWNNHQLDQQRLVRGLVYLVKEHAVAKAKAMVGVDPQWSQP